MKVSIIGSGVYGKAMGKVLIQSGNDVVMWTEREDKMRVGANEGIALTNSFEEAVESSKIVFVLTGGKFVRDVLLGIKDYISPESLVVLGAKSILKDGSLMTDLCENILPDNRYAVISGPTFALDIGNLEPVGFTLATEDKKDYDLVSKALNTVFLEYSKDVIATEMAGSLKNVYAIGSGIINGLGYGHSTKCLLITKSLYEIRSIYESLGLESDSLLTLATTGDLILTCTSNESRNYSFGTLLAKDKEEASEYLKNTTVEGYENMIAYKELFSKKNISAPILKCIASIIEKKESPSSLIDALLQK